MKFNAEHLSPGGMGTSLARKRTFSRKGLAKLSASAAASLTLLSACGTTSSPSSSANVSEITVWHYTIDPVQAKVITDAAAAFEKLHPGIKVNSVYVPYDQLDSKLIVAATAQHGPDVVLFNNGDSSTLEAAGVLAPLDKYWAAYQDKAQFPLSTQHFYNNKLYAVQGVVDLVALWYNKDLMTKLGISSPPTTIDELNADMAKAKAAGYHGITITGLPNDQSEWQAYPWLTNAGFSYSHPTAASLESAFATAQGWINNGYLSKEAVTWDQTLPFQQFETGNVLFAENGDWQAGTAKVTAKFAYGVAPLPLGTQGKLYMGGTGNGIGAFSKAPDLAWAYIEDGTLSKSGEVSALQDIGSIPARLDMAKDPAVTSSPISQAFASLIRPNGVAYPSAAIPPKSVAAVQILLGQTWSAVLGGQLTPQAAADKVMSAVKPLLNQ
jgi:multiple sugar transport system substrate-binding protein